MTIEKGHNCVRPVCSCETSSGKYCSVECAAMEKTSDIDCPYSRSGCKGKTSK